MSFNIAEVLKKWEHNLKGVPAAIQQDSDGSCNYTDVNIWMWLKAVFPAETTCAEDVQQTQSLVLVGPQPRACDTYG